jgi:phosphatidylinositol 3,5-bisphosphate 5-phosphatase
MFPFSLDRDGPLDIRARSGDLSRLSSNADALSSAAFQDLRNETNKQEPLGDSPCYQTGVIRTNCIDCLDDTNVAQYAYGLAALGRQLHAMGLTDVPKIHPDQQHCFSFNGNVPEHGRCTCSSVWRICGT